MQFFKGRSEGCAGNVHPGCIAYGYSASVVETAGVRFLQALFPASHSLCAARTRYPEGKDNQPSPVQEKPVYQRDH